MAKSNHLIKLPPVTLESEWPEYIARSTGFIKMNLKGIDAKRFRQLQADLVSGARFPDGQPVVSKVDVIRWILIQAELVRSQSIVD